MNIAAFVNASGEIVDFYEEGQISLFRKHLDQWETIKTIPLSLERELGIATVRSALTSAVSQLGDCEVFIVRELRGILRVYLEEMGYRVWKSEGSLNDQLENVTLRELEMLAETKDDVPSPLPIGDPEESRYRIDLVEILQSGLPHVSRDVLLPFFETVSFQSIEIVCEHLPKWFAMELPGLGLVVESQTADESNQGKITAVVVPKCGARSCPPGKRARSSCHCG